MVWRFSATTQISIGGGLVVYPCIVKLANEIARSRAFYTLRLPSRMSYSLTYLIEVGQATGMLSGHLAAKRPEDLPG